MKYQGRRVSFFIAAIIGVIFWLVANPLSYETSPSTTNDVIESSKTNYIGIQDPISVPTTNQDDETLAINVLNKLEVKGRAPKTGYTREQFYNGWPTAEGCNLRQRILKREFGDTAVLDEKCMVIAGEYDEPYTGKHLVFKEREEITKGVQIDHIVALSDAWQKGAQKLTATDRYNLATDPLNLIAVDASTNQKKSDGDAATWLPPNKGFRCQYIARQISVKYKYHLWVTEAEKNAMITVLNTCPNEPAVGI